MTIELIVLTKSDKQGNFCVAGIRTDDGSWIRLENENVDGYAMSEDDITYSDGSKMKELDVISVECEQAPDTVMYEYHPYWGDDVMELELKYQPENYLIDAETGIQKIRTSTWSEVLNLHPAETKNYILASPNQCMTLEKANNLYVPKSLQLVHVTNLRIGTSEQNYGHVHPRAEFDYQNRDGQTLHYNLTVTDPDYKEQAEEEVYEDAYLVISLGLPFSKDADDDLNCYLLIAKVITDYNPEPELEWV